MAPHLGSEAGIKRQSANFPSNGALKSLGWKVRKIACHVLATAPQEVPVRAALPVVSLGVIGVPPRSAASAPRTSVPLWARRVRAGRAEPSPLM